MQIHFKINGCFSFFAFDHSIQMDDPGCPPWNGFFSWYVCIKQYRSILYRYTRLQKRWHLESINCNCKRKSSEYALGILFFPAMYFLLQRIRIVNYWLSWWKWGYCLNTTHKSVGSHRSRFMLSRCQRFCNRVYVGHRTILFELYEII